MRREWEPERLLATKESALNINKAEQEMHALGMAFTGHLPTQPTRVN